MVGCQQVVGAGLARSGALSPLTKEIMTKKTNLIDDADLRDGPAKKLLSSQNQIRKQERHGPSSRGVGTTMLLNAGPIVRLEIESKG